MLTVKIAPATPFEGAPKINVASVFGASPEKPLILRIPVTGQRPIVYGAKGLPDGLTMENGIITGKAAQGDYDVLLTAENALGKAEKKLRLEIRPRNMLVTPLMGFTTWNYVASRVRQTDVENVAWQLVDKGISEYGYCYVNVDSGWQDRYGGAFDAIMPNDKFTDMKAMTDYVHSLGLKCGIYSTPMLTSWGCPAGHASIPGCTQGEPDPMQTQVMGGIGKIRKEKNNALQWAAWGFDYLKYDWRPTDPYNAELMRKELEKTHRDFGFNVSTSAIREYPYWRNNCSSYRSGGDSNGTWQRLMKVYSVYPKWEKEYNKGHYFDMDMLDVGPCVFAGNENYLTEDEQIVAYSLRAFLSSPLQLSCDLDKLTEFDMALICNDEIIAINQDTSFAAPTALQRENGLDIYEKQLQDGSFAYALFNLGEEAADMALNFGKAASLRDLWAKEDMGKAEQLKFTVAAHAVRIVKSDVRALRQTEVSQFEEDDAPGLLA